MLGPVELRIGGQRIGLGPTKQRTVVAALLLSPGRPVGVDVLIDQVWGDEPPAQARNSLYTYLSRLRRLVGQDGDSGLRRAGGGYVLDVDADLVDALRFRGLVDRARRPGTPDHERLALVGAALDLWHGTPLSGLTGDWVQGVRYALEQQRITAAAEWAELALRTGAPRAVIDRVSGLLTEHPLAEVLSGRLMQALHRTGRRAEALEHYRVVRHRVAEELGVEPGPELRAILRAIETAEPPAPAEPDWAGLRPYLVRLIGRADESARLAALLTAQRLVTVTGVGGCGKTALALRVAHEWARRTGTAAVAVALATVTSFEQIVHAMAELLGAVDGGTDGGAGATVEGALAAVARVLAAVPQMLVLDNCEHLAGDIADLVTRLLSDCPELCVLATSRQPLGVAGEAVLALEPLPVPAAGEPAAGTLRVPSVELFVERVRLVAPEVSTTGADLGHVAELCRRLDGLPLALELVAARTRAFPLPELVDRVGHDLTLLFRTSRGGDARHTDLDTTLDWSFRLLSASHQRLLARLSVFAAGFTAADAETVCGFAPLRPDTVAAELAALVEQSLVHPYDQAGTRRFRLLNVIRVFAAARLEDLGESETTARHHLDRWLTLARSIDQLPLYEDRIRAWRAAAPDAANLRRSLQSGLAAGHALDVAEIVATNFEFWLVNKGYLIEGRAWLRQVLASPELADRPDLRALLRFHHALVLKMFGDGPGGLRLLLAVVPELTGYGRREHLEARAGVLNAKMVALDPSVLDEVEPAITAALDWPEPDDARMVVNVAGSIMNTWGRYERTLVINATYDQRVVTRGRSSAAAKLTVTLEALLGMGDLTRVALSADTLLDLLGTVTHAAEQAAPRRVLATYHLVSGQPDRARRFLHEALATLSTAQPPLTTRFLPLQIMLAEAQRQCGDTAAAVRTLDKALLADAGRGNFKHTFAAPLCAALIATDLGDTEAAQSLTADWDQARRAHGLPVPVGFAAPARTLGLDPAPAAHPPSRWNTASFTTSLSRAASYTRARTI